MSSFDRRFLVNNNCNSTVINHSIESVSKIQLFKQQQQKIHHAETNDNTIEFNHVAESHDNSITGIKLEILNDYLNTTPTSTHVFKSNKLRSERKYDKTEKKSRVVLKTAKGTKERKENLPFKKLLLHAKALSENVIAEPIYSGIPLDVQLVHLESNVINKRSLNRYKHDDSDSKHLTRFERLNMRKIQLRHVLNQYKGMNRVLQKSNELSKIQFIKSCKLLKLSDREKEFM